MGNRVNSSVWSQNELFFQLFFLFSPGATQYKNNQHPEPLAYFPVEPGKTGTRKNRSFSTGTARKFSG